MKMPSKQIILLLEKIKEKLGGDAIQPYGTSHEEEHGTGFIIKDVAAIFSVHTQDGKLPEGNYDVQIESNPPGEYLYTDVVTLNEFLNLVNKICGPEEQWPIMT